MIHQARRPTLAWIALLSCVAVPASAQDGYDALVERLDRQEREIQALREEVRRRPSTRSTAATMARHR